MRKALKGKRILVTAGPTWVAIDRVRVISNISSGLTGITIAQCAAKMGANVTLLLGPVSTTCGSRLAVPTLKVKRFKYFDELKKLITIELAHKKYDILIHAAAVSDYRPVKTDSKKIKSEKKKLVIELKPTVKIIDQIRRQAKAVFLVMFKLEAGEPRNKLIEVAYKRMRRAKADIVVANNINEISGERHKAYIIDGEEKVTVVKTKDELAKKLLCHCERAIASEAIPKEIASALRVSQ